MKTDDRKLDSSIDKSRREALEKIGKRSVYLSPVVMTLLTSKKASAISPPPPPP